MVLSEAALQQGCHVTLSFIAVYTLFYMAQLLVKITMVVAAKRRGDDKFTTYNTNHPYILLTDRAVGNMLEQGLVFLPLFWMALATAAPATVPSIVSRGYLYVAVRAFWPAAWWYVGPKYVTPPILLCTGPMYAINAWLFYTVIQAVA